MNEHYEDDLPSCPFCSFKAASRDEREIYRLMHHLETSHPENGYSPFVAEDSNASPLRGRSRVRTSSRSTSRQTSTGEARSFTPLLADGENDVYVSCPAQCGEAIHIMELPEHMDLHEVESLALDDLGKQNVCRSVSAGQASLTTPNEGNTAGYPYVSKTRNDQDPLAPQSCAIYRKKSKRSSSLRGLKGLFLGTAPKRNSATRSNAKCGVKRLGKTELGPHAYEERMPAWLYQQLERGAKVTMTNEISPTGQTMRVEKVANETRGMIYILSQLCQQDQSLSKVFLCHPAVKHVFKTPREGGFCGYRNIQMLVSFLQGTKSLGSEHFPGMTPSILRLQDLIEEAWDKGINSSGRIETGGIRGTRKYIGTPEAQALFCSLNISCEASAFNQSSASSGDSNSVHDLVFEAVLTYFSLGVTNPLEKVYQTELAPIYFQHPGHSLTIVGLEIRKNGESNLLVLDPMFKTAPGISRLVGTKFYAPAPEKLLKAYRRGHSYLAKYNSFELLKLV